MTSGINQYTHPLRCDFGTRRWTIADTSIGYLEMSATISTHIAAIADRIIDMAKADTRVVDWHAEKEEELCRNARKGSRKNRARSAQQSR